MVYGDAHAVNQFIIVRKPINKSTGVSTKSNAKNSHPIQIQVSIKQHHVIQCERSVCAWMRNLLFLRCSQGEKIDFKCVGRRCQLILIITAQEKKKYAKLSTSTSIDSLVNT